MGVANLISRNRFNVSHNRTKSGDIITISMDAITIVHCFIWRPLLLLLLLWNHCGALTNVCFFVCMYGRICALDCVSFAHNVLWIICIWFKYTHWNKHTHTRTHEWINGKLEYCAQLSFAWSYIKHKIRLILLHIHLHVQIYHTHIYMQVHTHILYVCNRVWVSRMHIWTMKLL